MKSRKYKKKKSGETCRTVGHDSHLVGPDDERSAHLAADRDSDHRWFAEHPGQTQRIRQASPDELRAAGLPPGTVTDVAVLRLSNGALVTAVFEPAVR